LDPEINLLVDAGEIVVIVRWNGFGTALFGEDRQVAENAAELGVDDNGMHALSEAENSQRAVVRVQPAQHEDAFEIARIAAIEADVAAGDLLAEHFDLLTDHVVDRADDIASQALPGVDGDDGRNVRIVKLRSGRAGAGAFYLGDRQEFVARKILRR